MELDTGASVSIISLATYNHLQSSPLESSDIKLKTYSGEVNNVLGSIKVKVRYNHDICDLSVFVVDGDGPNLMGRDWLSHLNGILKSVNAIQKCIS